MTAFGIVCWIEFREKYPLVTMLSENETVVDADTTVIHDNFHIDLNVKLDAIPIHAVCLRGNGLRFRK